MDCPRDYADAVTEAGAANRLLVVKVTAKFCRACRVLEPTYQQLANDYKQHGIDFRTIHYENNKDYCTEVLKLRALPAVLCIAPGGAIHCMTGGSDVRRLEAALEAELISHVQESDLEYGI